MPTEPISALPVATTANAGDLVVLNQSGVTKTVAASAIAALASGGGGSTIAYDAAILATSTLSAYWKCNDAAGSSSAADALGGAAMTVSGSGIAFGSAGILADGDTSSAASPSSSPHYLTLPTASFPTAPFTLEFLVSNAGLGGVTPMIVLYGGDSNYLITLYFNGTSNGWVIIPTSAFVSYSFGFAPILFAITITTGQMVLYVNGIPYFTTTSVPTITSTGNGIYFAGCPGETNFNFNGKLGKIALYSSVLTQAQLNAHVTAAGL